MDEDNEDVNNAGFEIPLNTLIECLNIFGTAGPISSTGSGGTGGKTRGWQRANERNDDSDNEYGAGDRNRGGLDTYFAAAAGGLEKRTSMRMTYFGAGYPLTLIMLVLILLLFALNISADRISELKTLLDRRRHARSQPSNPSPILSLILIVPKR